MEFFRHCYSGIVPDGDASSESCNQLYQQFCEFGFLDSSTDQIPTFQRFYTNSATFYYYKDSLHQGKIRKSNASDPSRFRLTYQDSNGNTVSSSDYSILTAGSSSNSRLLNVIFIPLKNNGFLLHGGSPNSSTASPDFLINASTGGVLAGIAPTNKSYVNNYIYLDIEKLNLQDGSSNGRKIDLQKTRVFNPFYPTASAVLDSSDSSGKLIEQNMLKTDVNPNCCTLIQMPYDSYFLDNVFIMATAPMKDMKRFSFFSFGGRNFINVTGNLVLELPND